LTSPGGWRLDNCAIDPLTLFEVTASEDGVSLVLAIDGYEGSTNVNLADGSDTQSVQWYNEDGDLAEITSITVTVTENGRRRSVVQATRTASSCNRSNHWL
jgi:hypothetical protein